MAHIVDDRSSAFLEEVRKAMEASRQEAGIPTPTVAPSLADIAVAVRESGLAGALNNMAARTISHGVRFFYSLLIFRLNFIGTVQLFSACTVRSFSYHDLLYLDHCVPLVVT